MKLPWFITVSLALSDLSTRNGLSLKDINPKPYKVIPNGCKEYFFAADGTYSTEKMLKSQVVYTCIASKDKTAIKKFNNWASINLLNSKKANHGSNFIE